MDMTKKFLETRVLKNLQQTYCRIQPSPIHGVGVFAVRDIPEKTNPFPGVKNQRWVHVSNSGLETLDSEVAKMVDDFFVRDDGKMYVSEYGLNGMDMSAYVNSSESPNLITTDDGITFVTSKYVRRGEELTIDYGTYDENWRG